MHTHIGSHRQKQKVVYTKYKVMYKNINCEIVTQRNPNLSSVQGFP